MFDWYYILQVHVSLDGERRVKSSKSHKENNMRQVEELVLSC